VPVHGADGDDVAELVLEDGDVGLDGGLDGSGLDASQSVLEGQVRLPGHGGPPGELGDDFARLQRASPKAVDGGEEGALVPGAGRDAIEGGGADGDAGGCADALARDHEGVVPRVVADAGEERFPSARCQLGAATDLRTDVEGVGDVGEDGDVFEDEVVLGPAEGVLPVEEAAALGGGALALVEALADVWLVALLADVDEVFLGVGPLPHCARTHQQTECGQDRR